MVSTVSIIFMVFSALITIIGPILAAILFYRKQKYFIGSVFIGAAVFFVFQIVVRVPILQGILPKTQWFQDMQQNIWIYALFLGFTAGLVEEVGRYLAFTLILKKQHDWKNAVAYGIGHGGIESIVLVGLSLISNIITSLMINSGMFDALLAQTPEQARVLMYQTRDALVQTPSLMFLISGAERLFTFFIHIAWSVFIMTGIRKGKGLLYLCLAILLHTVVDSAAVILTAAGLNILIIEGVILVFSVISFIYIRKQRANEKNSLTPETQETV